MVISRTYQFLLYSQIEIEPVGSYGLKKGVRKLMFSNSMVETNSCKVDGKTRWWISRVVWKPIGRRSNDLKDEFKVVNHIPIQVMEE